MTSTDTTFPVTSLQVVPLPDPVIDAVGFDPRSAYVERYWLGVLGPSATWLVRRLADGLEEHPEGFPLDLVDTASALGLGHRGGRNSPFMRTLERCCRFGSTELVGTTLRARRKLPPLNRSQLDRLPAPLRQDHGRWIDPDLDARPTLVPPPRPEPAPEPADDPAARTRRARQLALSLLDLGEDGPAAERQLHRWRVHPAVAHAAVAWAVAQRRVEAQATVRPQDTAS